NLLAFSTGDSTGRTLFDAVLAGGGVALGVVPGFQPGAALDAVSLRADHPALIERRGNDLLDSWIFAGDRGAVENVWRYGQKVVAEGEHVRRDAITARYRAALGSLLA